MSNHTTLHINCEECDKAAWVLTARIVGMSFENWVTQQLNAAKIDCNPVWASGLSERATTALLTAGFNSREQVQNSVAESYDFAALSNAGNRIAEEITTWAK